MGLTSSSKDSEESKEPDYDHDNEDLEDEQERDIGETEESISQTRFSKTERREDHYPDVSFSFFILCFPVRCPSHVIRIATPMKAMENGKGIKTQITTIAIRRIMILNPAFIFLSSL